MKVLVVDDHALIRQALRGVLKDLGRGAEILEARDLSQMTACIEANLDIQLLLLDLTLPDADGFEILADMRDRHPEIPVVVLSANQDREVIRRALDLGALGFIPKSAEREVMLGAFELIFSGGVYVPPEILGRARRPVTSGAGDVPRHDLTGLGLTARQQQVLRLMMQGKSNKAICRVLEIAEPTVKNHVTAILRALGASNRTEAVIAAGTRFPALHSAGD